MNDDGFERVYVELEWYDGPRAGIADIRGVPHRFKSNYDEDDDASLGGTFSVFAIDADILMLEQEQWCLFVAWQRRCERGEDSVSRHPAHGGIDSRWDELDRLLADSRGSMPQDVRKAKAERLWLDREERYAEDGPDYRLRWVLL